MSQIKRTDITKPLIVTDLDGTMLPKSKLIPPAELRAIREFEAAGGLFTVATGRALHAAERYFDELDLRIPMILYNGCALYDTRARRAISERFLDENAACELLEAVAAHFPDIGAEILREDGVYVPMTNAVEENHIEICRTIPKRIPLGEIPRGGWYKALFAIEPSRMRELSDFVNENGSPSLRYVESERHFLELLPPDTSKGSALRELTEFLGAQEITSYAVGDYYNDMEMLRAADFGVATANACEEVRQQADIVLNATCEQLPITELIGIIMRKM